MPGAYLPAMLSSLLGLDRFYLLPFQILSLARTASMSMNVFISQLAPPDAKLQASQSKERGGEEGLSVQAQKQLTQIVQLAQAQDAESAKLLGMDMLPFRGDVDRAGRLRRGMKERLRREEAGQAPEVQQAIAAAKHRRQQGQNEHQRHQEEEEEEE